MIDINAMMAEFKKHPDIADCGMILCHNGVVRGFARDGRMVSGLRVTVDHAKLEEILQKYRQRPGIVDVQIKIEEDRDLKVGDDVMVLIVGGDIRENVIATLSDALNDVKAFVTSKTQFFI